MVHGGEALARHEGRVVFLRGGVPGDLVEAELAEPSGPAAGARFLRGRIAQVLERGAARVEAPCPVVDRCGGCPLQQIAYPAQLEAKQALLRDALLRIGGIDADAVEILPIVASPRAFRYRRRARFHRGPGGSFGFSSGEGVVPVAECLLFEPALQELADAVRAAAARLGGLPGVKDLGLDTIEGGKGAIELRTARPPSAALRARARALLDEVRGLRGVVLGPVGRGDVLGDPVLADAPRPGTPFRLRARPDLFAQANRAALPLLQAAALAALGDAAQGRVLELFCGAGTFTLPLLTRSAGVVGVEQTAASLALLRKSADEAGFSHRLRLVAADAAAFAQKELAGGVDAILLDPPRTGALAAVRALAALKPASIVYVSCDAPTLGRDAAALFSSGYRLSRAQPLDLFPQTAHLEVVATFQPS